VAVAEEALGGGIERVHELDAQLVERLTMAFAAAGSARKSRTKLPQARAPSSVARARLARVTLKWASTTIAGYGW